MVVAGAAVCSWSCSVSTFAVGWMRALVMVRFMCQFDWALGCPDIWLDILGVSFRVFEGISG